MAEKPNIIFIFPDQHRGDTMGCVGHPVVQTPNLDHLSSEAVTLNRCYTNAPLCMPARASLQTGRYVCEHGVWNNFLEARPDDSPSYVRNIRDAGYHTAVVGKTHLWMHGRQEHTRDKVDVLQRWGFEDIHELTGPIASMRTDSHYTDYLAEKGLLETHRRYLLEYYARRVNLRSGEAISPQLQKLLDQFSLSIPERTTDLWLEPASPLPTEEHLDSYTGRKAEEWIQNYNKEQPFFLMIGFPGPHDPFDSPAEYRAKYEPEKIPVGIMDRPREPIPEYVQRMLKISGLDDMTESYKQRLMAAYYGKVSLIDEYIGRILKAAEEKGLLENTWIIYSSDHGEMLGDHRLTHKLVYYDSDLRIPCIIRPPGGVKGWQSTALTDQLDLAATMLEITGADPFKESDGCSLVNQVLAGPEAPNSQKAKDMIFSELMGFSMIRDDHYKMVINSKTQEPVEMYDLENDPDELNNVVLNPSLENVRQDLLNNLKTKLLIHLNEDKLNRLLKNGKRIT